MEIVFRLTREDLRELALFFRRKKAHLTVVLSLVLLCLLGLWMGFFLWSLGERIISVMFIFLFASIPVALWFKPSLDVHFAIRGRSYWQEERRILISDENLRLTSKTIRSEILWSAFDQWEETPNLFILRRFDGNYQVLPKRAFPQQGSEQFRDLVKRKVQSTADASKSLETADQRATPSN